MLDHDIHQLKPAYILHRSHYSNTSVLIECLTLEQGRLPLIAKGVLNKSGGASALQPFVPLLINWSGRGEVKSLRIHETSSRPLEKVSMHGPKAEKSGIAQISSL